MKISQLIRSSQRRWLGTITHVQTTAPAVALTFDDGPHPAYTLQLLELLQTHQARATFFMVGELAQRFPHIVRQVAQAGHAIGNHSWNHPSFDLIRGRERRRQIRKCEQALAPYGQKLLRPPFGHQNFWSRLDALWLGYKVITWNVTAGDWLDRDAASMFEHIQEKLKPGSIVLLHDSLYKTIEDRFGCREELFKALGRLLTHLQGRYRFVTVPELLAYGRPGLKYWNRQADPQWVAGLQEIVY